MGPGAALPGLSEPRRADTAAPRAHGWCPVPGPAAAQPTSWRFTNPRGASEWRWAPTESERRFQSWGPRQTCGQLPSLLKAIPIQTWGPGGDPCFPADDTHTPCNPPAAGPAGFPGCVGVVGPHPPQRRHAHSRTRVVAQMLTRALAHAGRPSCRHARARPTGAHARSRSHTFPPACARATPDLGAPPGGKVPQHTPALRESPRRQAGAWVSSRPG